MFDKINNQVLKQFKNNANNNIMAETKLFLF